MNLFDSLSRAARLWPSAPAVALGAQVLHDYRGLAARAVALSGALRDKLGLARGSRVAIIAKNCPAYFEILYGCWHAGLVAVPTNAKLHAREFAYIVANSGAALAFVTPELASSVAGTRIVEIGSAEYRGLFDEKASRLMEPVAASDPAWLFYTSGTTGQPKGATLSHRSLLFMTLAYFADVDSLGVGDTMLHAAPLSHGAGLYCLPHVAGGSLNLVPESAGFDPDEILLELSRHTKLSMFAAPTMVTRLMAAPRLGSADLTNLKTIIYGGAPMYLADGLRAIERFGPRLFNLFGQGESPMTITGLPTSAHAETTHPRFHERLASCGQPRTGVEVRVVDEDDRDAGVDEVGEIMTRSDCVMDGYWGNPDASKSALRGGWLHTGDLGSFDADGFLTIRDRSKDMIISGGSNIYPREIEEVLLRHPLVAECSVVGRPHADWGEEVVAFVVAKPGATLPPSELDRLCLENIARFKRPKDYRFIDALPKNNYGKVLKTELRKALI